MAHELVQHSARGRFERKTANPYRTISLKVLHGSTNVHAPAVEERIDVEVVVGQVFAQGKVLVDQVSALQGFGLLVKVVHCLQQIDDRTGR